MSPKTLSCVCFPDRKSVSSLEAAFGLTETQRFAREEEERNVALVEIQLRDEHSFPALGVSRGSLLEEKLQYFCILLPLLVIINLLYCYYMICFPPQAQAGASADGGKKKGVERKRYQRTNTVRLMPFYIKYKVIIMCLQ